MNRIAQILASSEGQMRIKASNLANHRNRMGGELPRLCLNSHSPDSAVSLHSKNQPYDPGFAPKNPKDLERYWAHFPAAIHLSE